MAAEDDAGVVTAGEIAPARHLAGYRRERGFAIGLDPDEGEGQRLVFALGDGGDAYAPDPGADRTRVQRGLERCIRPRQAPRDGRVVQITPGMDLAAAGHHVERGIAARLRPGLEQRREDQYRVQPRCDGDQGDERALRIAPEIAPGEGDDEPHGFHHAAPIAATGSRRRTRRYGNRPASATDATMTSGPASALTTVSFG